MDERKDFRYLPHTADVKFEAFGKTYDEVFANAGYALSNIMIDTSIVDKKIVKKINLSSQDILSLLYDFLEEIILLLEVERFVISEISKVELDRDHNRIFVKLTGDEISEKYEFKTSVKAVTYNDMKIEKRKDDEGESLVATVVIDI
jgi:SHS2 domain-containing protein